MPESFEIWKDGLSICSILTKKNINRKLYKWQKSSLDSFKKLLSFDNGDVDHYLVITIEDHENCNNENYNREKKLKTNQQG